MKINGQEDFTPKGWKLVWGDEFDYNGLPDPKKWDYEVGRIRNNEAQYYTRARLENARVEGGKLVIEGRKEPFQGAEYTAASVTTKGRAGWHYGRFCVRARVPKAVGTWPAIWTLGEDIDKVGWPRCGEIDIMEHVAHDLNVIHGTIHQDGADGKHVGKGGQVRIGDASDAFHVYSAEWYPDRLDFFVDDKKYFTYAKSAGPTWEFDRKHYLLLNLAIGGNWGGQKGIDAAAFPQRFEVEFVRIYQKP